MLPEPIKLSTESTKKIDQVLRSARRDLGMILVKGFLMAAGSVIPIVIMSSIFGLIQTSFPMLMGFVTALMIQFSYVNPRSREVGERYAKEIKEIIEEEKRRQAQEG